MPKPIHGKPGNGWHVHQYLTKGNKNIFFKSGKYGNLSREGLSYVSGILFHAGSLCALTNPSTNSYKRLVEGFEAPNEVIFAKSNRIGAIRIPAYTKEEETRIEYRVGDASSNPYLSLSSMILAGLDGIKKNLDPEKFYFGPFDSGIRSSKMLSKKVKKLPRDLAEALSNLEKDYDYLKADEVFSDDLVSQWIKIKREEIDEVMEVPYPKEFEQYFYF